MNFSSYSEEAVVLNMSNSTGCLTKINFDFANWKRMFSIRLSIKVTFVLGPDWFETISYWKCSIRLTFFLQLLPLSVSQKLVNGRNDKSNIPKVRTFHLNSIERFRFMFEISASSMPFSFSFIHIWYKINDASGFYHLIVHYTWLQYTIHIAYVFIYAMRVSLF